MAFDIRKNLKLLNAIKEDKLIVFVGAGLSINLINKKGERIGGWKDLALAIINEFKDKEESLKSLIQLSDHLDPITILDLVRELVEKSQSVDLIDIKKFIVKHFDLDDKNTFGLHRKIGELTHRIISTNFDRAFEFALPDLGSVIFIGKNYELTVPKSNSSFLLKIHGCVSSMDTLVLFTESYNRLYNEESKDAKHALKVFKNLADNFKMLFIGFGMGDRQITQIFKAIRETEGENSEKHFIITKDKIEGSLNFLSEIRIDDFDEIDEILNILIDEKKKAEVERNRQLFEKQEEIEKLTLELERKRIIQSKLIFELSEEALQCFEHKEFEKAIRKYSQIIEQEPDIYDGVYNNWGNALVSIALNLKNAELIEESFVKYEKAISISPDYALYYSNLGYAMLCLAKLKNNDTELLEKARRKCLEALELGGDSYNLACCYALMENKTEACKMLELSLMVGFKDTEGLLEELEWERYKNDPDFLEIINKSKRPERISNQRLSIYSVSSAIDR